MLLPLSDHAPPAAFSAAADATAVDPAQAKWERASERAKEYKKEDSKTAAANHKEDMAHWKAFQKARTALATAPAPVAAEDLKLIDSIPAKNRLEWLKGERAAKRMRAFTADERYLSREQLRFDQRLAEARRDAKDRAAAARAQVAAKAAGGKEPCPPLEEDCIVREMPKSEFDTQLCMAVVEITGRDTSAYLLTMYGDSKVVVTKTSGAVAHKLGDFTKDGSNVKELIKAQVSKLQETEPTPSCKALSKIIVRATGDASGGPSEAALKAAFSSSSADEPDKKVLLSDLSMNDPDKPKDKKGDVDFAPLLPKGMASHMAWDLFTGPRVWKELQASIGAGVRNDEVVASVVVADTTFAFAYKITDGKGSPILPGEDTKGFIPLGATKLSAEEAKPAASTAAEGEGAGAGKAAKKTGPDFSEEFKKLMTAEMCDPPLATPPAGDASATGDGADVASASGDSALLLELGQGSKGSKGADEAAASVSSLADTLAAEAGIKLQDGADAAALAAAAVAKKKPVTVEAPPLEKCEARKLFLALGDLGDVVANVCNKVLPNSEQAAAVKAAVSGKKSIESKVLYGMALEAASAAEAMASAGKPAGGAKAMKAEELHGIYILKGLADAVYNRGIAKVFVENKFEGAEPLFKTPHPRWVEQLAKDKWPKLAEKAVAVDGG